MFDPIKEFENNKNKFNKILNFEYKWKDKGSNYDNFINQFNKFKNKLGKYIKLYDKKSNNNNKKIYTDIYPVYKEFMKNVKPNLIKKKESFNEDLLEKSIENNLIPYRNNYLLKKNNKIYKGTKYFYTPEQEEIFNKENLFGYYGDKYIAFKYAKRYNGGVQVYKLNRDIRILNVTNDKNIKLILEIIKNEYLNKDKADEIFFNKISYKEFYKAIKTKYGVGINKYQQANNISLYKSFNELWLYSPFFSISNYLNNNDKSYTGWLFSAGYIDRVCANGIRLLLNDKFDGFVSRFGFFTPYRKETITGVEFVLWNQKSILKRLPNDEFDSMQFIKYLHFDPLKINFNINYFLKNNNFQLIDYYINNKIDQKEINNIKNILIKKNQLKVMSLNINNFNVINLDDTPNLILKEILNILDQMDIDLCFLQEYNSDFQINSKKYNYLKDINYQGLVVLYKNKLDITNIKYFKIENYKYFKKIIICLHFDINNKKFAITHLDKGKPFIDRSGVLLNPKDLYEVIKFNYELRINHIQQIIDEVPKPDFIIGEFNFESTDKEYKYLTKEKKYYSGLVDLKTPFNSQINFIFSKKPYKFFTTIKFSYSFYPPIIAILDI